MRVLVACEYSCRVRDAFRALGHDAWSCDLLEAEGDPTWHHQGDVRELLDDGWDLMIGHPECTYLTNAGVRWFRHESGKSGQKCKGLTGKARWAAMEEGAEFFNLLKNAPIEKICLENPVPHSYARERIGKYTQIVQPYQFGDPAVKATCLWLKNLPCLEPTNDLGKPKPYKDMTIEEKKVWYQCHHAPPGPDRWKERSRTYQGIADAMAVTWGS